MKKIKIILYNKIFAIPFLNFRLMFVQLIIFLFSNKDTKIDPNLQIVIEKNLKFEYLIAQRVNLYFNGLHARFRHLQNQYCLTDEMINRSNVVVDVGANIGELLIGFDNKKIKYFGFEPSPQEYRILGRNISNLGAVNAYIYNVALGYSNSEVAFYLKSDTADSSVDEITNFDQKISVPMIQLDQVKELAIEDTIDLIKLEAEGFEYEILLGSTEILKRTRYISVDCGFEKGVSCESSLVNVVNLLMKENFKMIDFHLGRFVFLFENTNLK